ncbi:YdcF family protein [Thalassomonas sp. RHCl1]|uniref:YdcF family protein n=1 Tax=Thalassomonas sp. RHCl1 TaxID=2995320 RepID=UPI00248CF13D|nr:YdcF family protein [Thalassomonas sp. RHCl1]
MLQSKINYQDCAADISGAILLAGGLSKTASGKSDWSALGDESLSRTVFLASQLDRLNNPSVIISGGSGAGIKEAELMADLLGNLSSGKPLDIISDVNAIRTRESALFVRSKMPDENAGYYLVTSDWHMARAQAIFEHHGVKVCPLASGDSYVPYGFPGWFIPQKSALAKFELAWHELGGLLLLWWTNR